MMSLFLFVYEVIIRVYGEVIKLISPFYPKAKEWHEGRKNWAENLKKAVPSKGVDIWMHCASLGEFEQGRPVLEVLKEKFPHRFILLTFFSPSGYEIRKNYEGADYITYLPLDTKRNARQFIEIVKPGLTLFVKYEFWANFLSQLHLRKFPVLLISAVFRENQLFFKWYGHSFKRLLYYYKKIFVQDERSASFLERAGIMQVEIAGDTRFDRVAQLASAAKPLPVVGVFLQNNPCLVAGSTWPEDEELLKSSIEAFPKWIIAPHEISEGHLRQIEKLFPEKTIRYSRLINRTEALNDVPVLLIDNIGMLASLYEYGEVAYIGGGFGRGIHNILEAAVFKIPVVFGPRYHKFKEAADLISEGGAFSIGDGPALNNLLQRLREESFRKTAGQVAGHYVQSKKGATLQILRYISEEGFFAGA